MNAEIIAVGTELLLGTSTNTDARDVSLALSELGINVFWHTVVGDNPARLSECLDTARARADLIITTGGLGPTCDDLTKQTIARAFGRELYFDEEAAETIRSWFGRQGRTFTENNLRQAWLPEGCTVLANDIGTAPGCLFESDGVTVAMLPGPPRECNTMLRNYLIPWLAGRSEGTIRSHMIRMYGVGESAMEERLRDLMDGANPTVAPYAKVGECLVRVTAKAAGEEECEAMMAPMIEEICRRMGDTVYGIDSDSLEARVLELLLEKGMTFAAAESCTGGLVAQRLTAIPGASAAFRGGVTVYTEPAKTALLDIKQKFIDKHGVVSAEVARKMAKRVRKALGSDLGVGITGWAGPDGEDVGLVFVALAVKGQCFVRRLQLGRDTPRHKIRLRAMGNALDMVRRYLSGLDV
ncbi:MAG: competence/damage-inducible protein A [Oscillospiraceae bacterium]|nr:competence/damage-inducible protein A [Oscillospiraceae bacterium]